MVRQQGRRDPHYRTVSIPVAQVEPVADVEQARTATGPVLRATATPAAESIVATVLSDTRHHQAAAGMLVFMTR